MAAVWALGIAAGLGLGKYLVDNTDEQIEPQPQEQKSKRNVLWVFEDYKQLVSSPTFVKNRFQRDASLVNVSPGQFDIPNYTISSGGYRTQVARMPTVW